MTIQEALEKLQSYEKATFALNHATGLMYYDGSARPDPASGRSAE